MIGAWEVAVTRWHVIRSRRVVQWASAGLTLLIGIQFTRWVTAHLAGRWPDVARPAGVEAFLPIDAMLALRHWLETGVVDPVHPAALAIFVGIVGMSLLVARSFCSHLCPFGLASELLARLGDRLVGRNLVPPRWLDRILRAGRYLLLLFFAWAAWWAMGPAEVAAFLDSPYARVADVKMWLFFAPPGRITVAVIGVLVVSSVFVRDAWCRYLCPYGALLGLVGRLAPFTVARDRERCTDCRACTRVCPSRLPVHALDRVRSVECTSCQDCVAACPLSGCLEVAPIGRRAGRGLVPVAAVALAVLVYVSVVGGFRLTGHWHTSITEAEYHRRLKEIRSPLYSHVAGQAMSEPPARDRRGPGHDMPVAGPATMAR